MKKFITKRLEIRELNLNDAPFIFELLNSPNWLEFIGDRHIKTIKDAENYLTNGPINSYKENNFGLWLVEIKETNIPIGICGILKRDTLESPDIGYALLPKYMNQGFAFEAAQATLNFAITQLKIPKLLGITKPNHTKSIKVLEKIGMNFDQFNEFNSETLAQYIFPSF